MHMHVHIHVDLSYGFIFRRAGFLKFPRSGIFRECVFLGFLTFPGIFRGSTLVLAPFSSHRPGSLSDPALLQGSIVGVAAEFDKALWIFIVIPR